MGVSEPRQHDRGLLSVTGKGCWFCFFIEGQCDSESVKVEFVCDGLSVSLQEDLHFDERSFVKRDRREVTHPGGGVRVVFEFGVTGEVPTVVTEHERFDAGESQKFNDVNVVAKGDECVRSGERC